MNRFIIILLFPIIFLSCYSKKEIKNTKTVYEVSDFISLINQNDMEAIKNCFHSGFNIQETIGENEITFLDYAILKDKEEIAIFLISNGIDVNHVDKNGLTTFSKAIGRMSPKLLNAFLDHKLDISPMARKNMNYFVYMLYRQDYSTAFEFITNKSIFDYFKNETDLFTYLIYYWDSEWSSKIGDFLLSTGYKYDKEIPYYFYAIDEYSLDAVKWLDSIGIPKTEKYYEERFNLNFTALEYAENKIVEMTNYLGKDYAYSQEDEEIMAIKSIIDWLSKN